MKNNNAIESAVEAHELEKILSEIREMAQKHSDFFFFEKIENALTCLSLEMHFREEFEREILDGAAQILRAHGARDLDFGGEEKIDARWIVATF